MSKARLSWARQCGERKAKEHGFDTFPIDPFVIASAEDILVVPKRPDQVGVSGGIIFGDEVGIFYSTDIKSDGFQRFTIGHELGHYFLDGHPEEILKVAPAHISRAGFTEGNSAIELEADHFASGLLLPTRLVQAELDREQIGLEGIEALAEISKCSLTASAIRAAECSPYPMAIVMSRSDEVRYAFLSEGFKKLGRLNFLRRGCALPQTLTRRFNADRVNVEAARRACELTTLNDWFGSSSQIELDEQVIGLGEYGFTLTVLTSENLPPDPDEEEDEEAKLIESYRPKFAYGR
ncbi:ImmA/IrrE family metallo-endopeptidase [Sphingomonas cannabina]|uniref:ImmA/IrrE family metallo-endopeptidase n=1 Tax=Sphingomonas cannabina TaxID=2899123 RepID=UPI001F30445A|nr:ImmA/IrrE family metallo-endopeptidase [Sphingomonas cannabina]UIJ46239.1 ImmA/IrrE family metallo-endopeptidase [Sphingomonas cannabina]